MPVVSETIAEALDSIGFWYECYRLADYRLPAHLKLEGNSKCVVCAPAYTFPIVPSGNRMRESLCVCDNLPER